MITHPDYVQKIINKRKSPEHPEDVRYIYPLPNGVTQEDYVELGLSTNEGYVFFEFNFDFEITHPNDAELKNATPQNLRACVLNPAIDCQCIESIAHLPSKYCGSNPQCNIPSWANVIYYANLHKTAYEEKFKAAAGVE